MALFLPISTRCPYMIGETSALPTSSIHSFSRSFIDQVFVVHRLLSAIIIIYGDPNASRLEVTRQHVFPSQFRAPLGIFTTTSRLFELSSKSTHTMGRQSLVLIHIHHLRWNKFFSISLLTHVYIHVQPQPFITKFNQNLSTFYIIVISTFLLPIFVFFIYIPTRNIYRLYF